MQTIGRRFKGAGPGDFPAMCSYCGTFWYRSELTVDESGLYVCPQEGDGLDAVALSEGNAAGAAEYLGPGAAQDSDGVPMPKDTDVSTDFTLRLQGGSTG